MSCKQPNWGEVHLKQRFFFGCNFTDIPSEVVCDIIPHERPLERCCPSPIWDDICPTVKANELPGLPTAAEVILKLKTMKVPELTEWLASRGLRKKGTRAELQQRCDDFFIWVFVRGSGEGGERHGSFPWWQCAFVLITGVVPYISPECMF